MLCGDQALRAMAAGVTNEVLAVQKKSADAVNARVDDLVNDIAGTKQSRPPSPVCGRR